MLRAVAIVALAGLVSAQLPGLSSQCMSALTGLVANEDASTCLGLDSLLSLATVSNDTSIVGPINDWTANVCAAAPCSNQTLAAIVSNITSGCQNEIGSGTDPTTLAASITPLVQQYYPTVRKVVCLKDGNTNCLTQTLTNIESISGPLTVDNIIRGNIRDTPNDITCTDCIKAAYNVIRTDAPDLLKNDGPKFQSQCGASFTDGNTPSSISQSAVDASNGNTQNSGATTIIASGLVSALTIVSTIVALI